MAFNLSGGSAPGAGADALMELLAQAARNQATQETLRQNQQRIELEAERNRQSGELQRAMFQSQDEARKSVEAARAQGQVGKELSAGGIGPISPEQYA